MTSHVVQIERGSVLEMVCAEIKNLTYAVLHKGGKNGQHKCRLATETINNVDILALRARSDRVKGCTMMSRRMVSVLVLLVSSVAAAQKNNDADKQKIIDIEQKIAATAYFYTPYTADVLQNYLYDGQVSSVNAYGRIYHLQKSELVAMARKPDPADPDVKESNKNSDFQVDFYGDTALATYKQTSTDTGHKDTALNGDYSEACLDTFIKRNGQWYMVGNACVPAAPFAQGRWDAITQMRAQEQNSQK